MTRFLNMLGLLPLLCPAVPAQSVGGIWEELLRVEGTLTGAALGFSVADAGDVNRDGVRDLVAGAPLMGMVTVYSSLTGLPVLSLSSSTYPCFGRSVAGGGDVNADGYDDILVGTGGFESDPGAAYVYSGKNGRLLYSFTGAPGGYVVAPAGDVDVDGFDDFYIAPDEGDVAAELHSGQDGSLLHAFPAPPLAYIRSLAVGGDANGDGYRDLVVGSAVEAGPGTLGGEVQVFSGATYAEIHRFSGASTHVQFGRAVSFTDDLDADGADDIWVGAPMGLASGRSYGAVYLYSGRSGALLLKIEGSEHMAQFGYSLAVSGDTNGDRRSDVFIGAPRANSGLEDAGAVYVHDGVTGARLHTFLGQADSEQFGTDVADFGAVSGLLYPDVLMAAPFADSAGTSDAGVVLRYRFDSFWLLAGDGTLSASSRGLIGIADFPLSEAGYPYAILVSATGTGPTSLHGFLVPLTYDSMLEQSLAGNAPNFIPDAYGFLNGRAGVRVHLIAAPGLSTRVGQTFYSAAVSLDPITYAGRFVSVPRSLTIVP